MRSSIKGLLAFQIFSVALGFAHASPQRVGVESPTGRTNPLVTTAASLVPQSGEGGDLKSAFNENTDRVRLMVLLSPT